MNRKPKRKSVSTTKIAKIYNAMEEAGAAARRSARPVRMAAILSALGRGILAA